MRTVSGLNSAFMYWMNGSLIMLSADIRACKIKISLCGLNSRLFFFWAYVFIVELKAGHFSPHIGAINLIKVEQYVDLCLASALFIKLPKLVGKAAAFMVFQVHHKEADIRKGVSIPQPIVKFNAIKYIKIFAKTNMFHVKIAVAIPYLFGLNPLPEKVIVLTVEILGPPSKGLEVVVSNRYAHIFFSLREILIGIYGENFWFSILIYISRIFSS